MDKLIELLQQIQELAGVGVDALKKASGGGGGGGDQGQGAPGPERGAPPQASGGGGAPPEGEGANEPMRDKQAAGKY